VLEKSYIILYYDRFIKTDRAVHNNKPDRVTLDKTAKDEYLIDAAIQTVTVPTVPSPNYTTA
jgi:hypothetical protein